jgi:hypothetical protein
MQNVKKKPVGSPARSPKNLEKIVTKNVLAFVMRYMKIHR